MKKLIVMIMGVAMMTYLVGCTKDSTKDITSNDTTSITNNDTKSETKTENTTSDPSDSDDISSWIMEDDLSLAGEVSFWVPFKGDQGMDAMIADFNSVYPNINVVLNTYSNSAEGNVSVNTAIMAGEVDVLASFEINNVYRRWENGLYQDLTEKVNEEGIDLVANWGTDVYTYNDKIYSLPSGGISYYVAINKTAWDEANLGEIPNEWTWDDYISASEAMTKKDTEGNLVYGGSDFHVISDILNVAYQVNGENRYYNADGSSSFNSDLIVNAVKRNIDAEKTGVWYPLTTYRADNNKSWITYTDGTVASTVINNVVRFLRDKENYPVDFITTFAPYPTEEVGQSNGMSGVNYFSFTGIASGCQDEEAAWAFLKWYATYGSKYLTIAGHQSTWKGTSADDLVNLIFGSEDEASKLIDVEKFKTVVGITTNPCSIDTEVTAYSELTSIWQEYVMYAYNGTMSVEEALLEAEKLANEAINSAK